LGSCETYDPTATQASADAHDTDLRPIESLFIPENPGGLGGVCAVQPDPFVCSIIAVLDPSVAN
jgi:hypothetical protein